MELTELIEKVKQQDQQAFEELYNRYYRAGFSLALQFVKNEEDALDIMQDAFVTVYSKLDTLDDASKFKSWYMQIVANKCRDFLKKQKPLSFTDANAYDEDGELQFEIEETDRDFIPEQAVDYGETVRLVDEMIAELPEEQRLCILLYFGNDMTIPEIAKALKVSEATVKSRLKYGKDKIRAKTEAYEKKTGTKLYSLAGLMLIPFLRWALKQSAAAKPLPPSGTFGGIVEVLSASGNQMAGAAGATAQSAGSFFSSLTIAQKVIGGVIAGAIIIGSSIGIGIATQPEATEPTQTTVCTTVPTEPTQTTVATQPTTVPPTTVPTQPPKATLYWEDYIQIAYEGISGYATAAAVVDFSSLDLFFVQDDLNEFMAELESDAAPSVASLLEFGLSPQEGLANGDAVTVTIQPSQLVTDAGKTIADLSDYFGIDFQETVTFTVEGLQEFAEIDILSMVSDHIRYEGNDGDAYAYWDFPAGYQQAVNDRITVAFVDTEAIVMVDGETVGTIVLSLYSPTPHIEIQDDLEFIYYESGPLSNGDILTIELGDYHQSEILAALQPLGYTLEILTYELEVSGL